MKISAFEKVVALVATIITFLFIFVDTEFDKSPFQIYCGGFLAGMTFIMLTRG